MGEYIEAQPYLIGDCPCGKPIDGYAGVRVDPEGQRWHPECRTRALAAPVEPRRGPGRPRKDAQPVTDAPTAV
jgi:hypothetical protein